MNFEVSIFNVFHSLSGQAKILDWLIIFLADYLGYFLIAVFIWMIFKEKDFSRRFYYFSWAALSLILSRGLLTEIIRFFYYRPRPFIDLEFSSLVNHAVTGAFPSGHAAFYFVLAITIFYLEKESWKWKTLFVSGVVLMGLARIAAGVHWPLDILGGALVAAFSVFVVGWFLKRSSTLRN